MPCHEQCRTCSEEGVKNCDACKYYREGVGGLCVRECGADEFIDVANDPSVCLPCNSHCHGCAGPTHADCTKCKHYTIYDDLGIGEQDAEEDAADAEPLPVGTGRRFLAILAQFFPVSHSSCVGFDGSVAEWLVCWTQAQ